jgi:hypothetical protein
MVLLWPLVGLVLLILGCVWLVTRL